MEIFFGLISAACDRRPGGRWRRSRSLTTLLRVKSHSFPRQTTSTAPFSTAASCPPPFPFCRRPTLPLPFLRQAQSFILSLSVSLSPPAPICTFPFHSFFVSPCSILTVTKHKKLKTPTTSWNSIYTHTLPCCFGIWTVFVLFFISTFNIYVQSFVWSAHSLCVLSILQCPCPCPSQTTHWSLLFENTIRSDSSPRWRWRWVLI